MKSPVVKRSIVITGHKTSVSLEDAFWTGLKDIASSRNLTLSDLVASIDGDRRQGNLSSAIRLFVLDHYRALAGSARLTLHVHLQAGTNAHHMIEACFKALARALRQATSIDPEETGVPSTKGTLT